MNSFVKNVLTVALGVFLAIFICWAGYGLFTFWFYNYSEAGQQYHKNMRKMLDEINARNALNGIPPVRVGN